MNRSSPSAKRLTPPAALPVAEHLERDDAFARLRAGAAQTAALERDLAQCLPDYLQANVAPGALKDGTLTLLATHNALAARLRHLEPGLLQALQRRGWPVAALKIRVSPDSAAAAPVRHAKEARLGAAAHTSLRALYEALPASPLKTAVGRMVARHAPQAKKSPR